MSDLNPLDEPKEGLDAVERQRCLVFPKYFLDHVLPDGETIREFYTRIFPGVKIIETKVSHE